MENYVNQNQFTPYARQQKSQYFEILPNGKKRYLRATAIDIVFSVIFPFPCLIIGFITSSRGERKRGRTMMFIGGSLSILNALFGLMP